MTTSGLKKDGWFEPTKYHSKGFWLVIGTYMKANFIKERQQETPLHCTKTCQEDPMDVKFSRQATKKIILISTCDTYSWNTHYIVKSQN